MWRHLYLACLTLSALRAAANFLPTTLPPKSEPGLPASSLPKLDLPNLPAVLAGLLPAPTGPAATTAAGPAPSPAATAQSAAVTAGGLTVSPDRTATESGLTPYSHYPAPADNASNPQPYPAAGRTDQQLAYLQLQQVTGILRWSMQFTTQYLPSPSFVLNSTTSPTINQYGRRLQAQQELLTHFPWQHTRGLQQSYTYDSQNRLQYIPANGALITSDDFQQAFQTAIGNTAVTGMVLTPAGSYQVNVTLQGPAHLTANCNSRQQPFQLDLTGSTLTFLNVDYGGFYVLNCANVTMHGPATLTYATAALGFSQGTVTSIGPQDGNARSITTVQIDAGYPVATLLLSSADLLAISFNPANSLLSTNTSDIYLPTPTSYTTDSNGITTLTYYAYANYNLQVGARLAIRGQRGYHGITSQGNNNTIFANLTIETANQFAIASGTGASNSFLSITIAPRATPFPGTSNVPLISSVADGIHATQDTVGPTLKNNTILSNGDDAIAMEGSYFLVAATNAAQRQITLTAIYYRALISVGNTLAGFTNTSQSLGSATVTAVSTTSVPAAAAAQGSSVTAQYNFTASTSTYLLVTLSSYPSAFSSLKLDSLMTNPSQNCDGYTISNNTVGNNRGRGMIIKASSGTITGNNVLGPKLPGIMMVPDLYFIEAGFISSTTISNNYIQAERGGIQIAFFSTGFPTYPGNYSNHNTVVINSNTLTGSSFVPMLITSATNVQIHYNSFINTFCFPYTYLDNYFPFIMQGSLIELVNVVTVSGSSNTYSSPAGCQYVASSPYTGAGTESNVHCC